MPNERSPLPDERHTEVSPPLKDFHNRLEALTEQHLVYTPKERNERLQALYSAIAERRAEDGLIDNLSIDLLDSLAKSFNTSLKYEELEDTDDTDEPF